MKIFAVIIFIVSFVLGATYLVRMGDIKSLAILLPLCFGIGALGVTIEEK